MSGVCYFLQTSLLPSFRLCLFLLCVLDDRLRCFYFLITLITIPVHNSSWLTVMTNGGCLLSLFACVLVLRETCFSFESQLLGDHLSFMVREFIHNHLLDVSICEVRSLQRFVIPLSGRIYQILTWAFESNCHVLSITAALELAQKTRLWED